MTGPVLVFGIAGWILISCIVGPLVGRAIAIADQRETAMRAHPCVRPIDPDFERHADQAVALFDFEHWSRQMGWRR